MTIDDADFIAYEVSVAAAASTANAVEGATLELDVQRNSPPQFVQLGFTVDWQLTAVDGGPLGAFSSTSGSLAFGPFNETVHLSIPIADNSDPEVGPCNCIVIMTRALALAYIPPFTL